MRAGSHRSAPCFFRQRCDIYESSATFPLALRTALGTPLTVLERRHVGDGFVDIANVLSRLCTDYGKTFRFILFVGSYFAHSI